MIFLLEKIMALDDTKMDADEDKNIAQLAELFGLLKDIAEGRADGKTKRRDMPAKAKRCVEILNDLIETIDVYKGK
jgi:hypothetical protein